VKVLSSLAKICAIVAGMLLTVITLITCVNLILRNTTGDSMAGAFEITAVSTGAAIALFMPLCQARQGHIIVDFFTANASEQTNRLFDQLGAFVLGIVFAVLSWRTVVGCMSAYTAGSQTMLMGIPEWIVYAAMVPPFAISSLIGLTQAIHGVECLLEQSS
jgi:TRAP-type C4-dicarboxylate transport system permease small subunit